MHGVHRHDIGVPPERFGSVSLQPVEAAHSMAAAMAAAQ
jgi:hypothetical protein